MGCALLASCTSSPSHPALPAASPAAATTASSTSVATAADRYERALNALCLDLQTRELAANPGVTSIPSSFPVARYLVFRRNVDALTPAFDRRVAAVPVPVGASAVAADFRAYQREEDGLRAKAAIAARRSQAAFDAEYAREMTFFATDPVLVALDSDGFSGACHYR